MIDYKKIIREKKDELVAKARHLQDNAHYLDARDTEQLFVLEAEISVLKNIFEEMTHQEDMELDQMYLKERGE